MDPEDNDEDTNSRTCGLRCHHARRATCNCWCDGLFHGKRGEAARKAFIKAFGFLPSQPRESIAWYDAMQAAKKVRE